MIKSLNVYLRGKKVGELTQNELAQISFQYDKSATQPLSVRMPIRDEIYGHIHAYSFFENLIPEGDALKVIAQKLHVSENNIFSILDKLGGDCAGAVALYEGKFPGKSASLKEISLKNMAQIIDELPDNPLLTGLKNPPRLSLAGAQSKFAVYKKDGKYYRSNDEFPTNYIIKITNKRFLNLLENELFCMKLAKQIWASTPDANLKEIDGRKYLEIKRYDRDAANYRIHQEDFCQALGFPCEKKYQTDGGPKIKDCFDLIGKYSSNEFMDIINFIQWIIFNYLVGNTDAHAKNLSLLYLPKRISLAPFYDLLSIEVYPAKQISREIAMLINGKGTYVSLKAKDFLVQFEQLGLNPKQMLKTLANKFANIASVAEQLGGQLNNVPLSASPIYDEIIGIIRNRHGILFADLT